MSVGPESCPCPPPGRALATLLLVPPALLLIWWVLFSILLVGTLRWMDPPTTAFMTRHAQVLRQLGQPPPYFRHRWTPWPELSPAIKLAAIAGEDQRFPDHSGFDLAQIRRAWAEYRQSGRRRGASTITQQTAKNLFLWPGQDWRRKALEAWFALLMELLWPKERILEVYLNSVQFAPGVYGVGAASWRYFNRPPSDLTLEEAALMIGALPSPGLYRLDRPSAGLERRAAWIRDQAARLGGLAYLKRL